MTETLGPQILKIARDQVAGGRQDIKIIDGHEPLRSNPAVPETSSFSPHEPNVAELGLPPTQDQEESTSVVQAAQG